MNLHNSEHIDGEPRIAHSETLLPEAIYVNEAEGKGKGLFARRNLRLGELVFVFEGELLPGVEATPLALQVDEDLYLESTASYDNNLNHSCDPNCLIVFPEREL